MCFFFARQIFLCLRKTSRLAIENDRKLLVQLMVWQGPSLAYFEAKTESVSSLSDSEVRDSLAKAEVQSCSGCSLRSLPDVKSFIFEDVPLYEGVVYKNIQGAVPELVLFSENYEELKRIPLRDLSRKQCNELLQNWGFAHKEKSEL